MLRPGESERRGGLRRLDDILESLEQLNLHDKTDLPDHVAEAPSIFEEALYRGSEIAVARVAVDVEKLVPAADANRLVERSLLREAHEPGDAQRTEQGGQGGGG